MNFGSFGIGLLLGAVALAIILLTVSDKAGNGRYSFTCTNSD
jgi:hypothetical protein